MPRTKKKSAVDTTATIELASDVATVKTVPKKAAKKAAEVYLQIGGKEWNISDCRERAAEAYAADGHKESSIKKLVVYLKPEESRAYYVVNDSDNGSIDL